MIQLLIQFLEFIISILTGLVTGFLSLLQNPDAVRELVIIGTIGAFSAWFVSVFLGGTLGLEISQFINIALTTIIFYAGTWSVR